MGCELNYYDWKINQGDYKRNREYTNRYIRKLKKEKIRKRFFRISIIVLVVLILGLIAAKIFTL
jgi:hypothetical protein